MNEPLADFRKRKEHELRWKLAGLPDELKKWRERAQTKNALEKSHSQITRLSLQIEGLQAKISTELDKAVDEGMLWQRAENLEKKALILHTIWDQFRTRLSLRLVSPFDAYLALADAYARECYVPVYRRLRAIPSDQLCPAPLITFDQQVSPWIKPQTGAADPGRQADNVLTPQELEDALDQLPLPLLGLPWSYLSYLPHVALIAHEVGHALERSAALTELLDQAINRIPLVDDGHRPAWKAWRKEVFADWYGCMMGGPAYVLSLVDHLANDESQIARQTRPHLNGSWTDYPTATVRVLFCCHALAIAGLAAEGSKVAGVWSSAYPQNRLENFTSDFDAIINGFRSVIDLQDGQFQGFGRTAMDDADRVARLYRQGGKLGDREPKSARGYVTAGRLLAQEPPRDVPVQELWEKLRSHHLVSRPHGMAGAQARGTPEPPPAPEEIDHLATMLFARVDAPISGN